VNGSKHNSQANFPVIIIGRVQSPFGVATGTPIQSVYANGAKGQVIVESAFADALDDIDGFERLWLIYWMDRATTAQLRLVPYRDNHERGLFATRSPCRPNPIGMSVVRLLRREANILHVADLDILDNTPLLDIKPYVPDFDSHQKSKAGWFDDSCIDRKVADERFHEDVDPTRGNRLK
jgi:tRNA (adenine37-N6)-methyltransferase